MLMGYSNSLWTGNLKTKIWGPHYSKCTLIGKKTRTKSENLSPAKIKQTVDLQRWFNDSIEAINKRHIAGRSGLSNHFMNCHALVGQTLCFLDLMQFTSKYSKI